MVSLLEALIYFKRWEINSHQEYAVQHANLLFIATPYPWKGKIEA